MCGPLNRICCCDVQPCVLACCLLLALSTKSCLPSVLLIARCRYPNCWDNHGIGFRSRCYEWCCKNLEWFWHTLWGCLLKLFNTFVNTVVFLFRINYSLVIVFVCMYVWFFLIIFLNELWIRMYIIKFIFSILKYYYLIKIARKRCFMHCPLRSEALGSLLLATVLKLIYQACYELFSIYTNLI